LPRTLPDGSTIYDCSDLMGLTRKHGDEYERPNARFKYRCDNGVERIVACIGSERSGKALIKVGTTFTKDGFWHKCTHFPENETANYTEGELYQHSAEPECRVNDKRYHVGDDIRSGFFLMKCEENGYKIVVSKCSRDGRSYKEGERFKANHLNYECTRGLVEVTGMSATVFLLLN
uniref:Sushi domain-containing protein n=1 Tax=Toxocara canis TaxID=6265 RepID=A0A183U557_TOXCA